MAELYHELRNAGFKFEELDHEKTVGEGRRIRRLDLAYKPTKGGEVGVAIQVVPYQKQLLPRQLNDAEAFEEVAVHARKVLVLVRLGDARVDRSPVVREKLAQLEKNGVEMLDC